MSPPDWNRPPCDNHLREIAERKSGELTQTAGHYKQIEAVVSETETAYGRRDRMRLPAGIRGSNLREQLY